MKRKTEIETCPLCYGVGFSENTATYSQHYGECSACSGCGGTGHSDSSHNLNDGRYNNLIKGSGKVKVTYYYDESIKKWRKEKQEPIKDGCFLSTAICDILKKEDNCYELETLRNFRDTKLLKNDNLKDLVFLYYEISPNLVEILVNKENKEEFAKYLYNQHICTIVKEIEKGNTEKVISLYKNMLSIIN